MRRLLTIILLLSSFGFTQAKLGGKTAINGKVVLSPGVSGGGGGGSIAFVAGQNASEQSVTANTLPTLAIPSSVTSGNAVIIQVVCFSSGSTPTISLPTKSSGTATIGTVVQDNTGLATSGATNWRFSIFRMPITGSGTLTVGFTVALCDDSGSAISEYSGITAVDVAPTVTTGTSVTESTGSITTSAGGMVTQISSEASTGNFTYTQSDVSDANFPNGASQMTYQAQHKITSSAGSYTLTAGTANSWFWGSLAVAYK